MDLLRKGRALPSTEPPLVVPTSFSSRYRLNPALLNSREQASSQFAVTLMQMPSGAVNMLYMLVHIYSCVYSSSWQLRGFQVSKSVVMLGEWDKTASVSSQMHKIPVSHL